MEPLCVVCKRLRLGSFLFHCRAARPGHSDRHHQQRTHAGGMWGEEFGRIVIVEGESGRAAIQAVSSQVSTPAENSGFEMRIAITAISQSICYALEVGHITDQ